MTLLEIYAVVAVLIFIVLFVIFRKDGAMNNEDYGCIFWLSSLWIFAVFFIIIEVIKDIVRGDIDIKSLLKELKRIILWKL